MKKILWQYSRCQPVDLVEIGDFSSVVKHENGESERTGNFHLHDVDIEGLTLLAEIITAEKDMLGRLLEDIEQQIDKMIYEKIEQNAVPQKLMEDIDNEYFTRD